MASDKQQNDSFKENESWCIDPYEALIFTERDGEVIAARLDAECSIASDVDYITKFVKKVINTKRDLLTLAPAPVTHSRRPNTQRIKTTRGGECFLRCLQIDLDRILDKYPDIGRFNWYFGLYYHAVMREVQFSKGLISFAIVARFEWLNSVDRNYFPDDVLGRVVKYANEAIAQIRGNGKTDEFLKWQADLERQPKENEGRILSLIDACLGVNHHILALRFDLGYGQFYCDRSLSGEMAVSYREIRQHRVALRRFLKRELKNRLPLGACNGMAFAMKLEYGLDKGYHFHVIVILNGDVARADGRITEMICDQWKYQITNGRGGACNCNLRFYKRKGIGSIKHHQTEKLEILRTEAAPYIAKADFYRDMVIPKGHRTFWASHPPKINANPKGRKRAAGTAEDAGASE